MKVKEYGLENEKKLLFLHGAISDYSWYLPTIELLSKKWHTFVVLYDGYYEPFENTFKSVEYTVFQILDFCEKRNIDEFDTVYGLSMGGVISNLIYAYDRLKIKNLIIDGATCPYEYPKIITKSVLLMSYFVLRLLRMSKKVIKLVFPPKRWLMPGEDEAEFYDEIYTFLNNMKFESMKNSFDSTFNYSMPKTLPENDTKLYFFHGELEGGAKANAEFFQKTYPNLVVKEFHDSVHGELCMMKSKELFNALVEISNS